MSDSSRKKALTDVGSENVIDFAQHRQSRRTESTSANPQGLRFGNAVVEDEDDDGGEQGGGRFPRSFTDAEFEDAFNTSERTRRVDYYQHDPEKEFQQRSLAEESQSKYGQRELPLQVRDKQQQSAGHGASALQDHPAFADTSYGQGVAPALAEIVNNPEVLDMLKEMDPDQISPELRYQLAAKLGLSLGKKNQHTPTPSPLG